MAAARQTDPEIRSKKNSTGSTISAGLVVILDSTEDLIKLPTATTDHLYGVAMNDIPTGEWGDVQIRGRAKVLSNGALATPGILLMSGADGKAIAWTAIAGTNAQVLGIQETTTAGANEFVEVELAGPGIIKQG